jgi:hypothetical protein
MPELMKLMEDWNGYIALNEVQKDEGYEQKLKETIDLLSNARNLPPHRREYLLKEAITTSDFPYLFGDVLDRQVLASYKAVDPVWKAIVRTSTVKDFKTAYRFAITGGDQYLAEVAEKGEYPASERTEERYSLAVKKYGRQFDISWEALINDDLGALKDTPERFAWAAVRTEHRLVTNQYADDDGTHAAGNLYDKVTANEINGSVNLLTIANLETGLEAMAGFRDANGEAIMNRAKYLVVPPALEMTARQILTSATKMWTESAGGGATAYPTTNVVSQMGLTLIVDPYLPIMDTSNGNIGWYLFADPKDIAALEVAHLAGHERPEICMKASDKVTIGGGAITPLSGDFATDNVFYRVRLCFGICELDWRATYAGGLVN